MDDQPAGARGVLHARAARLLADEGAVGEVVCTHLMQAGPAGDEWVVEQLLDTARAALDEGAPEAAASLLARALSEPPNAEQRVNVLFELGRAEALGPAPASAVEHFRAALGAATERDVRDALVAEVMSVLWHLGRRAELLEVARAELERCDPHTPLASRQNLEAALIMGLKFNVGHYEELDAKLDALAPELTGSSPAERVMLAILAQRRVERAEPVGEAVAAARLALDHGLLTDHGPSLRAPSGVALRALIESDQYEDAARWISEGLELARARGSRLGLLTAQRFLAELAYYRGDLGAAEADARLVAGDWVEYPSLAAFCAVGILAQTLVARGQLEQADAALDVLGDGLQYPGFPNSVIAVARAELALARGDPSGHWLNSRGRVRSFPIPAGARVRLARIFCWVSVSQRSGWRTRSSRGRGALAHPERWRSHCGPVGSLTAASEAWACWRSRSRHCAARRRRSSGQPRCASWGPRFDAPSDGPIASIPAGGARPGPPLWSAAARGAGADGVGGLGRPAETTGAVRSGVADGV